MPTMKAGETLASYYIASVSISTVETSRAMPRTIEQFAASEYVPSLPEVAIRLIQIAQQDEPDFSEAARVISTDPALCGKILKTVNSALFGLRGKVNTIEEALPKLGLTMVRTLVLTFQLARQGQAQQDINPLLRQIWRRSLSQAVISELLGEMNNKDECTSDFLAGLLQDTGILVMLSECPTQYVTHVLEHSDGFDVVAAERAHFGFTHADVSAAIAQSWGLDLGLVDAIQRHHEAVACASSAEGLRRFPILRAASFGADVVSSPKATKDDFVRFHAVLKEEFDFTLEDSEELIQEACRRVTEFAAMFSFDVGPQPDPQDLLARGKHILEQIALKAQLELMVQTRSAAENPDALNDEVNIDPMTGCFNRRFMSRNLNHQLGECLRQQRPIGLIFLDVDKFKGINDTFGHAIGDEILVQLAQLLNQTIRKNDFVIRLGGDEFLIILQDVSEREVTSIVQRIVSGITLTIESESDSRVTLSAGGVHFQPYQSGTPEVARLIDRADEAMYEAKRHGGDNWALYRNTGDLWEVVPKPQSTALLPHRPVVIPSRPACGPSERSRRLSDALT